MPMIPPPSRFVAIKPPEEHEGGGNLSPGWKVQVYFTSEDAATTFASEILDEMRVPTRNDHNLYTGDIITCTKGHKIYEVTAEIPQGSLRDVRFFKPLLKDLAPPVNGQPKFPCPVCGEDFSRPCGSTLEFYINGKWK